MVSSRGDALACWWGFVVVFGGTLARPHRAVVQHSGSAAQDLDPPPAEAAQEVDLGVTPVGSVATNGVIVRLRDQQALVGTWSRPKSGREVVQYSSHARPAAPRPEYRSALGRSLTLRLVEETLDLVDPAAPRDATRPKKQEPMPPRGRGG
jgi:hypothetical protein